MKNENYVINSLFVKDFIYMAFLPDIAYLLDGTLENLSCFTVQYPANPYFLVEKVKSYSRKGETHGTDLNLLKLTERERRLNKRLQLNIYIKYFRNER